MAKHKTKTRHARRGATAARKHHTTHRRRRHVRRNPQGIHASSLGAKLKAAPKFALETVMHAGEAIAGKVVARKVRGLVNQQPGTVVGSLIEAGVGLVGGMVISMVAPGIGEYFALGGVMAPMETAIQQLKIPHVSDSLGDDGYLVGGDSGVTLVSAYPDDYRTSLGRYVSPPRPAPVVLVTDSKYESKHAA